MKDIRKLLLVVVIGVVVGCSDGDKKGEDSGGSETGGEDIVEELDEVEEVQEAGESSGEVGDISEKEPADEMEEEPGPPAPQPYWHIEFPEVKLSDLSQVTELEAGAAVVRMPVPLGICTAGFAPAPGKKTPYTKNFPGSTVLYMHPQFRAVAIEGGHGRLVILRGDMVGVLSPARQAVIKKLKEITGHDFSDELILAGTHTHSGPGRLAPGAFELLLDEYWPEFFDRFTDAMVLTVLKALKDMRPAKFGWMMAENHDMHHDRRCENPPLEDPQMPLLRFDDLEGHTIALILVYAVHGTILGNKLHHLSRDVSGAIELKVQEELGGGFPVLFINSWAADMGPGSEPKEFRVKNPSKGMLDDYAQIEGIGNRAARTVAAVWNSFEFTRDVEISARTFWVPLGRDVMGYEDNEFPYPNGGVYCGSGTKGHCWEEGKSPDPVEDLDRKCIPFLKDRPAPDRTLFTVGRIGNLFFITWPGEAVTSIGQDLREYVLKDHPEWGFAFFGYSQDYTGYSTPEWDWWQGGYEASGAIWGPKQGDYLAAKAKEGIDGFLAGKLPEDLLQTSAVEPPPMDYTEIFVPAVSIEPGMIVMEPEPQYPLNGTVEFEVSGGDPWLLAPIAVLQKKEGEDFKDVLDTDGVILSSDRYQFTVTLNPEPPYKEEATSRKFVWHFTFPIRRVQAQKLTLTPGKYRFRVSGSYYDGNEVKEFSVATSAFEIVGE